MTIDRSKELSKDIYLSLSDKLKMKMNENQFMISEDTYSDEMHEWIFTETNHPFHIEEGSYDDDEDRWVLFTDETDAVAFKLRWIE